MQNPLIVDIGKTAIVDHKLVESLIWGLQEESITAHTALSYGANGLYAFNIVFSPDGQKWLNGEKTEAKLPFLLMTSEQLEAHISTVTIVDGQDPRSNDRTGKVTLTEKNKSHMGITRKFIAMTRYDSNKPQSYLRNWTSAWRIAFAVYTGFGDSADWGDVPVEIREFVRNSWRHMSPLMLRDAYISQSKSVEQKPVIVQHKEAKSETRPSTLELIRTSKLSKVTSAQIKAEIEKAREAGKSVAPFSKSLNKADLRDVLLAALFPPKEVEAEIDNGKEPVLA